MKFGIPWQYAISNEAISYCWQQRKKYIDDDVMGELDKGIRESSRVGWVKLYTYDLLENYSEEL